jgi:hypothetical protein
MTSRPRAATVELLHDPQDFSFVLGGPLFQLLRRVHLSDDDLMLVRQRILFISLLAWLPLLVLSALERHAVAGVPVPFLFDFDVHIRFLVVVPLLIAAEIVVHGRLRPVVKQFLERHLVPESGMGRFDAAVASALRLRNSVLAEVLLIAFVYLVGVSIIWRQHMALDTATWYGTPLAGGSKELTLAGRWYGYLSLPLFQFLLCRWYFRIFIWVRFLWHVSRIELGLVPSHPDRVGGLGFLAGTAGAFLALATAHGAMAAGAFANRIFFLGAQLTQFKPEIAIITGFMLLLVFGPLLLFAPQLARAKRTGLREFGTLAQRYVREFDAKWLRGGAPANEPFIGAADIQSLADLGNSFEVVQSMRTVPVTRQAVVQVVAATLVPILPLALTMMPLDELLKKLVGVLF